MEIEIDSIERLEDATHCSDLAGDLSFEDGTGEGAAVPTPPWDKRNDAHRRADKILKDMEISYQRNAGILRTLDRIAAKL